MILRIPHSQHRSIDQYRPHPAPLFSILRVFHCFFNCNYTNKCPWRLFRGLQSDRGVPEDREAMPRKDRRRRGIRTMILQRKRPVLPPSKHTEDLLAKKLTLDCWLCLHHPLLPKQQQRNLLPLNKQQISNRPLELQGTLPLPSTVIDSHKALVCSHQNSLHPQRAYLTTALLREPHPDVRGQDYS